MTRAAADALADAGYEVVVARRRRAYEDVIATWTDFIVADIRMMQGEIAPLMSDDANRFLDVILDVAARRSTSPATPAVLIARQALMREWALWFADTDLLLTPTWTQLPFEHGGDVASAASSLATMEMMRPGDARQRPRPPVGVRAGRARRRPPGRRAADGRPLRRRGRARPPPRSSRPRSGSATPIDPVTA